MSFVDYYDVLQVSPRAEAEVIEKAYRALISKHHPDKGGDTRHAQRLNEAHGVIGDPARERPTTGNGPETSIERPQGRGALHTTQPRFPNLDLARDGDSRDGPPVGRWVFCWFSSAAPSWPPVRCSLDCCLQSWAWPSSSTCRASGSWSHCWRSVRPSSCARQGYGVQLRTDKLRFAYTRLQRLQTAQWLPGTHYC